MQILIIRVNKERNDGKGKIEMELNKYLPLTETTHYILLSLLEPAHGYIMMQKVEKLSNQTVKIAAGTMYGAIENLLKQKLIKAVKSTDKRRKTYVITEKGIEVLRRDCERMKHITQITEKLLPITMSENGGMEDV